MISLLSTSSLQRSPRLIKSKFFLVELGGRLKKAKNKKAAEGIQKSLWSLRVGTFWKFLLLLSSRTLGIKLYERLSKLSLHPRPYFLAAGKAGGQDFGRISCDFNIGQTSTGDCIILAAFPDRWITRKNWSG
jgi:hypothetical protein